MTIKGDGPVLKLKYYEHDDTWKLYNVHNENLHTHCKHKRVLVKIKKDIDKHKLPTTRNLRTLDSYTRVTTNKRYLRQIYRTIEGEKMNNDRLNEFRKQEAEKNRNRQREIEANPLSQYSTTQLKKELRRRKNE